MIKINRQFALFYGLFLVKMHRENFKKVVLIITLNLKIFNLFVVRYTFVFFHFPLHHLREYKVAFIISSTAKPSQQPSKPIPHFIPSMYERKTPNIQQVNSGTTNVVFTSPLALRDCSEILFTALAISTIISTAITLIAIDRI